MVEVARLRHERVRGVERLGVAEPDARRRVETRGEERDRQRGERVQRLHWTIPATRAPNVEPSSGVSVRRSSPEQSIR